MNEQLTLTANLALWFTERSLNIEDLISLVKIFQSPSAASAVGLLNRLTPWLKERELDQDELPSLMAIMDHMEKEEEAPFRLESDASTPPATRSYKLNSKFIVVKEDYKAHRAARMLSSMEAAVGAGVAQATILEVENKLGTGLTIRRDTAVKLHKFYNLPPPV